MKKAVLFLVPAILVVIGIALIASFRVDATAVSRSDGWNQARGTIEKIAEGTTNPIDVTFRYDVAGKEYRANRVSLGTLDEKDVKARLQRYTVGRTVLVYVNPANPAEAVLELSKHPARGPLLLGWNFIYLGIAVGIVLWWRSNQQRRKKRFRRPGSRPTALPKPPAPAKKPTLTATKRPPPRRPTSAGKKPT